MLPTLADVATLVHQAGGVVSVAYFKDRGELMQELNGLFQRILYVLELSLFGQIVLLPPRFRSPATR